MEIEKIKGHSFYIRGGTNSGVYMFKDKYAVIIDPGLSNSRANRIIKLFEEKGIRIKYIINTHEHSDHYGASRALAQHFTGAKVLSSEKSKMIIENPYIFSMYAYGGRSNDFFDDHFRNREMSLTVDEVLIEGEKRLNNEKFNIVDLKGHSLGHIGVISEDKVLYLGDSLFNESILEKYNFPFLFDIKDQLGTLNNIKNLDFDYALLGHGNPVTEKEETIRLIEKNEIVINKYLNQIREFLSTPYTREDLLKDIIEYNDLKLNYKEYHYSNATLGSMISYLVDIDELNYEIENGKLYYYIKK